MNLSNDYFGAVMDNAVLIILTHIFGFTYIFILVGYVRAELLTIVCMYFSFDEYILLTVFQGGCTYLYSY